MMMIDKKVQKLAGKRRYRRPIKRILLTCDAKSSASTGNDHLVMN